MSYNSYAENSSVMSAERGEMTPKEISEAVLREVEQGQRDGMSWDELTLIIQEAIERGVDDD